MSQTTGTDTTARLAALEKRLGVIADMQAIANLKARYLNAIDGGWDRKSHDGSQVEKLFIKNGRWHAEGFATANGTDEIRALFGQWQVGTPFGFHYVTNPMLEVTGDTAKGEWHINAMVTAKSDADGNGGGPLFAAAIYFDDFVRENGEWKIASVRENIVFFGPFRDGWKNAAKLAR